MPCCTVYFGVGQLVHTNTGLEYLCACVLHGLGQAEMSVGKSLAYLLGDNCNKGRLKFFICISSPRRHQHAGCFRLFQPT